MLNVADICLSSYAGVRLNHISRFMSPSEIISKNRFLGNITPKPIYKIKNGIYVGDLNVLSLQAKFQVIPSIFNHQMTPLNVQLCDVMTP